MPSEAGSSDGFPVTSSPTGGLVSTEYDRADIEGGRFAPTYADIVGFVVDEPAVGMSRVTARSIADRSRGMAALHSFSFSGRA